MSVMLRPDWTESVAIYALYPTLRNKCGGVSLELSKIVTELFSQLLVQRYLLFVCLQFLAAGERYAELAERADRSVDGGVGYICFAYAVDTVCGVEESHCQFRAVLDHIHDAVGVCWGSHQAVARQVP